MPSRRHFLHTCTATAAAATLPNLASHAADAPKPFSFILLGDLHYDSLSHHDMKWLDAHHGGDLSQIQNYSRLTAEVMPGMFAAIKQRIASLRDSAAPPAFVLQVGDLVEGLCGSAELSARQNREALAFVTQADLGLPFVFTKGNHDVTGDGAKEAFDEVLLPFMAKEARILDSTATHTQANHTLTFGDSQFAFFDAYDKTSLEWLEAVAAKRTAKHLFVTIHPPVVPYGARATWHLYAGEKLKAQRTKLLDILGQQQAMVLGGHLHKFSALTRNAGGKSFSQLAVSSVVSSLNQKPKDIRHGLATYTGDQINLEPKHSPDTATQRREIYATERKEVTSFEYADTAGFAVITVNGPHVEASVYSGSASDPFQTLKISV
ncbi:metallophosphoesterase family protein [Prosthecobacter sp.]|uniref:metallophosphoesterase family protein n=1 Tax=Prosthecobacter sp. TaxID=1965333 RepID=UPI003784E35D